MTPAGGSISRLHTTVMGRCGRFFFLLGGARVRLAKRTAMRAVRAGCLAWRGTASSTSAAAGRLSMCARRRPCCPRRRPRVEAAVLHGADEQLVALAVGQLEQLVDVGFAVADGDEPAVRAVPGGLLDGGQRLAAT